MSQSDEDIRKGYDLAAEEYAKQFLDELDHKPKDREWLQQFANTIIEKQTNKRSATVLDLGCGPGHTTHHLSSLSLSPTGIDLSTEMIAQAQSRFPHCQFEAGNFCQLPYDDNSVAGVLAFYCIVHLEATQLKKPLAEMFRVLDSGGVLLLSFHIGSESVQVDEFLGSSASLLFWPHRVEDVQSALLNSGFGNLETFERAPYEIEYPTRRCYIFAHKS